MQMHGGFLQIIASHLIILSAIHKTFSAIPVLGFCGIIHVLCALIFSARILGETAEYDEEETWYFSLFVTFCPVVT